MAVSMRDVRIGDLSLDHWRTIGRMILVNYGLFTLTLLTLAYIFVPPDHRPALILLALMPPAVGVVSLTSIFDGDLDLTIVVEIFSYIVGLLIIPLGTYFLFSTTVSVWRIIQTVLTLLVLPFALSRIIYWFNTSVKRIPDDTTKIVFNVIYFFSFYTVIALQRNELLAQPAIVATIGILLIVTRIGLAAGIFHALKHRMRRSWDIDYMLFGSFKNGGAALGFTLLLFGTEALLPLAINGLIVPLQVMFLDWMVD